MAAKTLLTVADYAALEEPAGLRYELNEGELIVARSADFFHNTKRDRINARMAVFLEKLDLGKVVSEMDVQLLGQTVRRADVAFFLAEKLKSVNLEAVPVLVAPDLVVEIVSKNDRADDLNLKVSQYLAAGVKAVWLVYPITRLAYRYLPGKLEPEVRSADAGHVFDEPELLPGFALSLKEILA